ncbi:MAG: hypothetical protein A4E53_03614 [Pelotomaculum sp. PtaB.Bin104]|nr:MAG: hypothetical protein A4E53_03614 [Pelotomaculum sp. PtaB.Bin104]
MRKVLVNIAWLVNAFENSSGYSEYYLDMQTGDIRFFSPLDFPEHKEIMEILDNQPDRYIKVPKLDQSFCAQVKKDYTSLIEKSYLKELLEKAIDSQEIQKFRNVLMEFEEERRRWYVFEHECNKEFLIGWFKDKGIELVNKLPREFKKTKDG